MIIAFIAGGLLCIGLAVYFFIKYRMALAAISSIEFVQKAQNPIEGIKALKEVNSYKSSFITFICVGVTLVIFLFIYRAMKKKVKASLEQKKLEFDKILNENRCNQCGATISNGTVCSLCGAGSPMTAVKPKNNDVAALEPQENPKTFCAKCGATISGGAFCPKCGAPVIKA